MSRKKARKVAKGMKERRLRKRELLKEEHLLKLLGRLKGKTVSGKNESGDSVLTKETSAFKIRLRSYWNVAMRFRREKKLPADFVEGERVPRKYAKMDTDIFRAVRTCKHIRENWENETGKRDEIVEIAEEKNAELAVLGRKITDDELDELIDKLKEVVESCRRIKSAYKVLGLKKLEDAIEMLEGADVGNRAIVIGKTAAVITAFRNRYGGWRDEQVEGMGAYNFLRECSLREERDLFLKRMLFELSEKLSGKRKWAHLRMMEEDREHAGIIKGIDWENRGSAVEVLHRIYKETRLKRTRQELWKAFMAAKEGNLRTARMYSGNAIRMIEWNKPWYWEEQMRKTEDGTYAKRVAGKLKTVNLMLERRVVKRAGELLKEAAELL